MKLNIRSLAEKTGGLLFLPTVLFLLVPHQLIKNNVLEFSYPGIGAAIFLALFILTFVATAGGILFWPSREKQILLVSATLGVNVFIWNVMGAALETLPLAAIIAIELALLAMTFLALNRMTFKNLSLTFAIIALLEIVWVSIEHYQVYQNWKDVAQINKKEHVPSKVQPKNPKGNVYHIILDTFQGEGYQWLKDNRQGVANDLFTYYPNFVTNEGRTQYSNAMLIYGDLYTPGLSPFNWQTTAYQKGFWADMVRAEIPLFEYPYHPYYCNKKAIYCKHTSRFIQATDNALGGPTRVFLDLTFLNVIPRSLKLYLSSKVKKATDGGDDFNWGYDYSITIALAPLYVGKTNSTHLPLFSKMVFEQLIADEASRPDHGSYIFAHLILPHSPYVLDENCTYLGADYEIGHMDFNGFMRQASCSLKLVDALIAKLKELGRLDNSLIIVHADHGVAFHPKDLGEMNKYMNLNLDVPNVDLKKDDSASFYGEILATRTSGLLLVKYPKGVNPTSPDVVPQTIDIGPTILKHFNLETKNFRGTPLQDLQANDLRPVYSMMTTAIPDIENPDKFSKYVRNPDGKWTFFEDVKTTR